MYQRYAFSLHIYTLFYFANTAGLPLIRPLWMEYPADVLTYSIGDQFMFGMNILVKPKLWDAISTPPVLNGLYNLTVYLPPTDNWYFYDSRQYISGPTNLGTQHFVVGDAGYGTFIRAGTVLPILNYQLGRMSLLAALEDNIRLEVFPDANKQASGALYLDDGLSHDYMAGSYTFVHYNWDGTTLTVTKDVEGVSYYRASNRMIDEISIFNVETIPTKVINSWLNFTPYPDQGENLAEFTYLPYTKELHIIGLNIPVDDGLIYNTPAALITII